ncbi:TetR/AcrR family transcriptional regulator [Erwinia sp. 198]|uniref:TetR/AcrR family transcriptional regulator n=1 Tax=Erwinia sp. 198 TaxID=2022746 RepID=UPI000F65BB96|nr:TetR/AcrR family transcriptional regulator [Erwinia sp. 198]RRZ91694.1 TetR/AcrR family transcriptional regulator [Erwinia sp. 198]
MKTSSLRQPGRPREFDAELALDGAIALFSEQGYAGTSISELARAMRVTPGSLYKAFADKQAIFLAALTRYQQLRGEALNRRLADAPNGRTKVEALLRHYSESSVGETGRRGCLVVSCAVELATRDDELARRIAQSLGASEARFEEFLRQGQQDGSVSPTLNVPATAVMLLCLTQGMRVLGKTGRTTEEMTQLVDNALTLLG